jgi:hypothetical protein
LSRTGIVQTRTVAMKRGNIVTGFFPLRAVSGGTHELLCLRQKRDQVFGL